MRWRRSGHSGRKPVCSQAGAHSLYQRCKGLTLDVDNNCDRSLSCALSWTVSCQTESGKVTRSAKDSARFVVAASKTGRAVASTKTCGDNWKIEDISWDCAAVK